MSEWGRLQDVLHDEFDRQGVTGVDVNALIECIVNVREFFPGLFAAQPSIDVKRLVRALEASGARDKMIADEGWWEFVPDEALAEMAGAIAREYARLAPAPSEPVLARPPGAAQMAEWIAAWQYGLGHGYTCDLCRWGRDKVRTVNEYAQHLRRKHCTSVSSGALREAARDYLANDGSQGRYDARAMIEARERLGAALAEPDSTSTLREAAQAVVEIADCYDRAFVPSALNVKIAALRAALVAVR